MKKETKDGIKQLIFPIIGSLFGAVILIGIVLSFDDTLNKEEIKNASSCDNINEHPEQYTFKTTQKDRFDECVKWYNDGGHEEYIKNGKQMNLVFKIIPIIAIPLIIFGVFRMFKQKDKQIEMILKNQNNKCVRCSSLITKDDGWFGGKEEQGWCEKCAITLGFDKESFN